MRNSVTRYHVAAGSRYCGKSQPLVLQAFLGTCVGVALYDRTSGVGGLIHLLLPEQVTPQSAFQPEKYASTGLPMLIEDLKAHGAIVENLRAAVAGGALVGPVSAQDLNLDIGGRTTELVKKILSQNGITIDKEETGGFFTCCLNLDMGTWETVIAPAGNEKLTETAEAVAFTREDIAKTIAGLRPIPQVALKILRIIGDEDYDISAVAGEVRQDQVISAKTLQLCNSAMFTRVKRVTSIDQALIRLGQTLFAKLVISASVDTFYDQSVQGYSLCRGGLYRHAIGTAVLAETLARFTAVISPDTAYAAGLLHDIGKVVLDQYIDSSYPLFYRQIQHSELDLLAIEDHIFHTNHAAVGCELAEKWLFPDSITQVITHHHFPENATTDRELVHIIYLADLLLSRFNTGVEVDRLDARGLAERLAVIGLSTDRLPEVIDAIPASVFESSGDLDAGNGIV
jgi:putative nucleotidyltransferase with HDIG domain